MDGVLWSATAAGGTDVKPCPNGASGKSKKKMRLKFLNVRALATRQARPYSFAKNGFTFTRLLYGYFNINAFLNSA